MVEQNRGEGETARESLEHQKYQSFLHAMVEKNMISDLIKDALATNPDRGEEEEILLERHLPKTAEEREKDRQKLEIVTRELALKMDKALEEERIAFNEWQRTIKEDQIAYEREIGK